MPAELPNAGELSVTPADPAAVRPPVAGLVLAAGGGRRYGMPKALVSYEGTLLVERACRLVAESCDPVFVVLGAAAEEVSSRADLGRATVVLNPDWETGMGSSLRTGLAALTRHADGVSATGAPFTGLSVTGEPARGGPAEAVLVHLVDLPGMTAAAIHRLASLASPEILAVATYAGVRGHPVLLGRQHWSGAAGSALGDQGARRYLAEHAVTEVECADVADPADLDYPPQPA